MTLMPGRRARMRVDQLPELPARQGIDAGGRLVEDQQIGIVNERAAQAELLPHAARSFLAGRSANGARPVLSSSSAMRPRALGAALAEQAGEEFDVLADAEVGIEILAQTLRHVGDARTDSAAMARIGHVAAEHLDAPVWIWRAPAMRPSRVDLPTPSGPISPTMRPAGIVERDVVERGVAAIAMRDAFEAGDWRRRLQFIRAAVRCSAAGQARPGRCST